MVILLTGEFSNHMHMWAGHLCMEVGASTVILSSRAYEHLDGAMQFAVESEDGGLDHYDLPLTLNGRRVKGAEYGCVVGTELIVTGEEIHLSHGEYEDARAWLEENGWSGKRGFEHAWRRIETALRSIERDPNEPEPDESEED